MTLQIAATQNTPSATAFTSRSRYSSPRDVTRRFRDALGVRRRSVTSQQKPRARQPPADPDNESGCAEFALGEPHTGSFHAHPAAPCVVLNFTLHFKVALITCAGRHETPYTLQRCVRPNPRHSCTALGFISFVLCLNSGWSRDGAKQTSTHPDSVLTNSTLILSFADLLFTLFDCI